ncbi:gdsl-like lipase acylhydrolase protein [Rutstroemia sp. NJR-2017a BBW]|nr:gdsl-like lipase acylhydrolase protein [Rutstroemia sp. NJR-2017a BBW]
MVAFNLVLPLAGVLLASAVEGADVAVYGQCGGSGYSGSTTCVSGAVCQSQNAYYYQCLEATGATTAATSAVASSAQVTSAASAISSVTSKKKCSSVLSASSAVVSSVVSKKKCSSTFATSVAKSQATSIATSAATSSQALVVSSIVSKVAATSVVVTTSSPVSVASSAVPATSASSAATPSSAASSGTKYLMIFGDSYSSDGFWAGSTAPSANLPLGVALPGTTTSGGLNWVGQTATQLNSSLVLAFDFAEYGATTDNSLVRGATDDLISQVTEFETYTAHNASDIAWTSANTMAVVWMGINDVGNSYWDGFATPFDKILDQYFGQLQKLYDAGIRYFTLFTVPPFDQAPVFAQQSTQNMNYVRGNITTYNADLVTRLAAFKTANSGVTGTVFNTSASFWTALDNPSAYGATDTTCTNSDGKTCLWYDTYHPGQAIQKLVAQNFVKALTGVFF